MMMWPVMTKRRSNHCIASVALRCTAVGSSRSGWAFFSAGSSFFSAAFTFFAFGGTLAAADGAERRTADLAFDASLIERERTPAAELGVDLGCFLSGCVRSSVQKDAKTHERDMGMRR